MIQAAMTLDDTMIIACIVFLAGIIVAMASWFAVEYKELTRRADKCEAERAKMWEEIAALKERIGGFERCPAEECPYYRIPDHEIDPSTEPHPRSRPSTRTSRINIHRPRPA